MADSCGRGSEAEFSEALLPVDRLSANTEGKGHDAFAW